MVLRADNRDPNPSVNGATDPVGAARPTRVATPATEALAPVVTPALFRAAPSLARVATGGARRDTRALTRARPDAFHQTVNPSCPF